MLHRQVPSQPCCEVEMAVGFIAGTRPPNWCAFLRARSAAHAHSVQLCGDVRRSHHAHEPDNEDNEQNGSENAPPIYI